MAHFYSHSIVDPLSAFIIGGHHDRALWASYVVFGDGNDAICRFGDLNNAALLGEEGNALRSFLIGEMLDDFQQSGLSLAHDDVELRSLHSGFLHLLEGAPGIDPLMLPRVSNDEDVVILANLPEEI